MSFTFLQKDGKGFSGTVTPLLPYMVQLVQNTQGKGSGTPTDSQHTPNLASSSHQTQKTYKCRKASKNTELPQASVRMEHVADEAVIGDGDDIGEG